MIPFNKPYLVGSETEFIVDAINSGKISGNGKYTKLSQEFFEKRYGFKKCLLTSSCTDALEMAAILCDIQPGDEVIVPSYTFVSSAVAFVREGAKIVFVDSENDTPNMDVDQLESLITDKTKAILVVHYSGVACNMDKIMKLADDSGIYVIEDAAHSVESYFVNKNGEKRALGSIGHLGTFSFHETKNIISGEGGMLCINVPEFVERAEIIWEKGTNRASFFRGEVNKYGWVDIGSSFLPSEIVAAFLYAQLQKLEQIQDKRKQIWNRYNENLNDLACNGHFKVPFIPEFATNNAHMYYLICNTPNERSELISYLKKNGVHAVFHYLSLHLSPFYAEKHDGRDLPMSDMYTDHLVRLPMFYDLKIEQVDQISNLIRDFFINESTP